MEAKEFGLYIRKLRKNKKMTIRKLELYSGVSNAYLSHIENGKRGIPSAEVLKKLSKPLGVDHMKLMEKAGHIDFVEIPDKLMKAIQDGELNEDDLEKVPYYNNGQLGVRYEVNEKAKFRYLEDLEKELGIDLSDPEAQKTIKRVVKALFAKEDDSD